MIFDPTQPLRPQPSRTPFDAQTIDEIFTALEHPESVTYDHTTDTDLIDLGTWILEALAIQHHQRNTNSYGPEITEALTVLSETGTEPAVTLTLTPTTTLTTLLRNHETGLETMLEKLVSIAQQLQLQIALTITTATTNTTIHLDPHHSEE
jgi:hypothetical protein